MPYTKEYYNENREAILAKKKKYYDEHKEEKKAYSKNYHDENREKIRERHRLWAKEKFVCMCGAEFRRDRKSEHEKFSRRHVAYLSQDKW